jgi:phosphoadenosine phosphosulfate reductase
MKQLNLSGRDELQDEIDHSIAVLQTYAPKDKPYYGCFSGGKDSCVIKELARMAGVNVVWNYNVTTIDPPELTRFIKQHHADVIWGVPKDNFFKMADKRGFPTRRVRWCCEEFKENTNPSDSVLIIGVRAAESQRRRKSWKEISISARGTYVLPILNWSNEQVWQFIRRLELPYCSLYDEGFKRLGCVGCPMAGTKGQKKEFSRWPHMERRWKQLFYDQWEKRSGKLDSKGNVYFGDRYFENWEMMWNWWLNDEPLPKDDECQGVLDFYA